MSFSLTERQILDGSKDVTRRLNWLKLKPGDHLKACRKCMGRRNGEPLVKLREIIVHSVTREHLATISKREVEREGFPEMTPFEFVRFFCKTHPGCTPETIITRIAFRYANT